MRSLILNEWLLFASLPRNARLMLGASSVSAFAMPVVTIFVHALILRDTQDVNRVMAFQFALYAGIPCAFIANRFLVGGRLSYAHLYAFGLVLCGAVLAAMTGVADLTWSWTVAMGLVMGLATGLLWANRNYLSLVCTEDQTRNYYFGVESFFYCISGVIVPAAVGWFLGRWGGGGLEVLRDAYRWVAAAALVLVAGGAAFLLRGNFPCEKPILKVRVRYPRVWRKLLLLATFKGTVHIFLTTAPAVLVMRVLGGEEGALGLVQSVGAVLAAAAMYGIGRTTRPHHRVAVLAFALVLYALAASTNALFYDRASVFAFMACQLLAQPMFDLSYGPILLGALDAVTGDGRESRYAYIVSHEAGIFAGRLLGACAFIAVACASSGEVAFRYALALMALLHVLCWPVAESIRRELGWTSRQRP